MPRFDRPHVRLAIRRAAGLALLFFAARAFTSLPAAAAEARFVSRAALAQTAAANDESRQLTSRRLVSDNGRFVAFASKATNLVFGQVDTNGTWDAFLFDRNTGVMTLLSHVPGNATTAGNGESTPRAISADGSTVAFNSLATNLVTGGVDGNGVNDAFVWRSSGTVTPVSLAAGQPLTAANGNSVPQRLSADGSWLLLSSTATNLGTGTITDGNGAADVFLWERATGQARLVSHLPPTAPGTYATGNGASNPQALSADGRYVAFHSLANNLVPGANDSNNLQDVFFYDRATDTVTLVSHAVGAPLLAGDNESGAAFSLSADGRYLAYESRATNLVAAGDNSTTDVFLWDRVANANTLVSHAAASSNAANAISTVRGIGADGRFVIFESPATNLVLGFVNGNGSAGDGYLWDRQTGLVTLVTHQAGVGAAGANGQSYPRLVSADGSVVVFDSVASNLAGGQSDGNFVNDTYVWERGSNTAILLSHAGSNFFAAGNGESLAWGMSADGAFAVVETLATDLVAGGDDQNAVADVVLLRNPLVFHFEDSFESGDDSMWSASTGDGSD